MRLRQCNKTIFDGGERRSGRWLFRSPSLRLGLFGFCCQVFLSLWLLAVAILPVSAEEQRPGGGSTYTGNINQNAFSHPSPLLSAEEKLNFTLGRSFFKRLWVSSPASTKAADGLGPLYNARSCLQCHIRNGRGHPPKNLDDNAVSMLVRLSVPAMSAREQQALKDFHKTVIPEPTYGEQLQDFAVPGLRAEGRIQVRYRERVVELAGGEQVSLRVPQYAISDLAYGPMHPKVMLSPRVAPPMIGLGLLEAIDEAQLLSRADPDDQNGDGISGRANRLRDATGEIRLGRFGWKAGNVSLAEQNAHAFAGDIGISTPLDPRASGDCTERQAACLAAPNGNTEAYDNMEVGSEMAEMVRFYSAHLAVPRRRNIDNPDVRRGQTLFRRVGCAACHVPSAATQPGASPLGQAQRIWPYTDLLLHDMGEGLADGRPEGLASGREWKTPPLWGVGLTETVSGHSQLLHDGRARNLLEAIVWHAGEAQKSRDAVLALAPEQRRALIKFLESL